MSRSYDIYVRVDSDAPYKADKSFGGVNKVSMKVTVGRGSGKSHSVGTVSILQGASEDGDPTFYLQYNGMTIAGLRLSHDRTKVLKSLDITDEAIAKNVFGSKAGG